MQLMLTGLKKEGYYMSDLLRIHPFLSISVSQHKPVLPLSRAASPLLSTHPLIIGAIIELYNGNSLTF